METHETKKQLSFSIQGEFITNLAREWLFVELKPYEKVEELLLSCMAGTNQTEAELKKHVQNILLGRAELRGNSNFDDYGLFYLEDEVSENNIFTAFSKLAENYKQKKEESRIFSEKYNDLIECLENWRDSTLDVSILGSDQQYEKKILLDIARNYGDFDVDDYKAIDYGNSLLNAFFKMDKFDDNYGWLDPTGKFYPVEFADHQNWAYYSVNYNHRLEIGITNRENDMVIDLSRYEEEFGEWLKVTNKYGTGIANAGDFLASKGWVLVHSPTQGIPVLFQDTINRMTKAQREFMYDYYIKRNENDKANGLYREC